MTEHDTRMRREILEIPQAVARLLHDGRGAIAAAADALQALDPPFVATVARGSSDHVATYLKYVCEILAGLPVASIGPSVASIYGTPLKLGAAACLSVSQSGQSPDIVELARAARAGGALAVAITNHPGSPLGAASDHALDIHAGPELSVAATKTFVTSAVAGLLLIAEWRRDKALLAAIEALPDRLEEAAALDWPEFRAALDGWHSLFVLGRGPGYAMSNEAALKFKETCQVHAESYSSAEFLHGPVSIVDLGFPLLFLAVGDAAEKGMAEVADNMVETGAAVFITSRFAGRARGLPSVRTGHALTDPIALIVSVYAMVERVAAARGLDPDAPRHLRKVTETV